MATTTPNYGWDVPTSTDYVKDGATAIETLGDDIDATLWTALGGAYPGLRLVKTQTIGTGVSSVTVTGAFSATYNNYKIVVSNGINSAGTANMLTTLGGSTTGYYWNLIYTNYNTTTPVGLSASNTSSWTYSAAITNADNYVFDMELYSPFLTKRTYMSNRYINGAAALSCGNGGGFIDNANSHTAFTLTPSTGTLTGGTIYVYGYGIN